MIQSILMPHDLAEHELRVAFKLFMPGDFRVLLAA